VRRGAFKRAFHWQARRSLKAFSSTVGEYNQKVFRVLGRLGNREWWQVKKIVGGVGDELSSILLSLNLYPLGLINFENLKVLSSVVPKRPVLLVHGYFHNNSVFYVLKRRLAREGWKHVYTINLRTYAQGIDECSKEIAKKVKMILKDTGCDRVDIIGHSFGGLCARYYIQALDGKDKVGQCITLGTPHQGTNLAIFGFGPANLDMQPGSDLLRELNEEYPLPQEVEFTNIWSTFDYMVIPMENSIMEGRVRNIKVDYVGHLGLLFSQKVFNEIFLVLSSESIHRKIAPAHISQSSKDGVTLLKPKQVQEIK